jgi:type II secretory ATPase GspE/PulE/Tfp pilus assembly ATPase PilB-like protein
MYTHENLRRMIIQKVGPDDLKNEAIKLGMKTLKDDIVAKFQQGLVTPEEVFALARSD